METMGLEERVRRLEKRPTIINKDLLLLHQRCSEMEARLEAMRQDLDFVRAAQIGVNMVAKGKTPTARLVGYFSWRD
jgi:hypothetical protein